MKEVIATYTITLDFSEMLEEEERDLGQSLQGKELRDYVFELFADSFSDLTRHINRDSIDIKVNNTAVP